MSQSPMAAATGSPSNQSASSVQTNVDECDVQTVLDAVDDADCRAILEVTSDDALTANEISEVQDLPLSTTYRKLDLLREAGMLEELIRIRDSGKHASEYIRAVDHIVVSLDPEDATEIQLSRETGPKQTGSTPSILRE